MNLSHDLVLKKARFKNFLSFGNQWTELDLSLPGTTLVMGENLDKGGSSGSGKSTLVALVSYCWFDKIPSKVSKDRLINSTNDKKLTTMEAEVYFNRGSNEYIIKRWRGATTGVQLFENKIDITPDSVNNINAKIEELVGISYRLFSLIVLFSGNNSLFLDSSVGEQRAIMEELFKITTLSQKANSLKKVIIETEKSIALQKLLIKHQEQQGENRKKQIAAADLRIAQWQARHEIEIEKAAVEIERISNIDFESEEQIHLSLIEIEDQATSIQNELKVIQANRNSAAREKSPVVTEVALLSSKIQKDEVLQKKLQSEHRHLNDNKCPYCLQQYADSDKKITEIFNAFTLIGITLEEEQNTLKNLKLSVDSFDKEISLKLAQFDIEINAKTLNLTKIKEQISEFKSVLTFKSYKEHNAAANAIESLQAKAKALSNELNPHIDALDAIKAEEEIKIETDQLDELVLQLEHQAFLLKLLTDKNSFIRKNIIGQTIPFLNKRIGYYTQDLNMQHMVLFQPDMTCEISQMGRNLDHGNLSNGEKKVLNLALCLAFRDVRTYMHSKINVLFTDEIDGGSLSGPDIDALIGMLKRKAWDDQISIFVISHRPEFEGKTDRSLIVRKEGGFSTLISQPES